MGCAETTRFTLVFNAESAEPCKSKIAADERKSRSIAQHEIADTAGEQREFGHIDDKIGVRDSVCQPVENASRQLNRGVFRTPPSLSVDEIVTRLPFLDKYWDHLGRIFAIGVYDDVGIAG